ncbi:DEAD/DEAH box helicase [Brevundimonas sp.]|jgi:ATP-dependent RNA helicase HelY|uniref:DEAD/DEAH box helicase n=1 Tax=Brevundimonas sp. TaxID=1871086 RepID=UPI00391D9F97
MFDAQTAALIRSAPALEGVDPSMLPQELTGIYAELAGLRLRAASLAEQPDYLAQLARIERIATIYEALVDRGAEDHERRAAAFVAATAYQLLARIRPDLEERDELLTTRAIDPRVSAPLLFLIAEQSPDAREAARELAGPRLEDIHRGALVESVEDLALERFEAILERANRLAGLRPGADAPFDERATQALYGLCWSGLVQMVARLLDRPRVELAYQSFETPQHAFARVVELATRPLNLPDTGLNITSSYAGPRHLARLLMHVADGLEDVGVTRIPPPAGAEENSWKLWVRHRASSKPVLWPNHRAALATHFLDVGKSAVLVLPTGAGKTTLSELKIASTLSAGKKVIFLVPTLALVDQLRDDLAESFPESLIDSVVSADGDLTALIRGPELESIEVMTPERCLALLSFTDTDMSDLGLLVFDECHLLSPDGGGSRSVDAMLCLLHAIKRAPNADLLLLSAMLKNAGEVADWLATITGRACVGFHDPWKPSRQARGVVIYPKAQVDAANMIVRRKKRLKASYKAPPLNADAYALFGLHHAWLKAVPTDMRLVRLSDVPVVLGHGTGGASPNANDVGAALAKNAAVAGLKTIMFVQQADHAPTTAKRLRGKLPSPPALTETENSLWVDTVAELGAECCSLFDPTAPAIPHNGDMIPLERRLAESVFKKAGGVNVIVATPTLAQGMNLPAQIAILAGTMRHNEDGRKPLEGHEILNAAGRAGRAGHLANGTVLLIPEPVVQFDANSVPESEAFKMLKAVLPENDQCVTIDDPLTPLLDRIQAGELSGAGVRYLLSRLRAGEAEDTAVEMAVEMISRSFAGYQARQAKQDAAFDEKLGALKTALDTATEQTSVPVMQIAAFTGLAVEPLAAIAAKVEAEIDSLPSTVCDWMEWLIDFMTADRTSYALLFGSAVETVKAVTRGKKTGGDSTAAEMTLLKTALSAWLKGEPFDRIEASLGVPAAKIGVCKRTRDLINRIANRQLYMVAAAAAEVIRQTLTAKEKIAANPAVLEIFAYAIRRGVDSPEKVAFAYRTPNARSRVLLHRAFAETVGDRPPVLGSDFEHVMRHLDAILAFGSVDLPAHGSVASPSADPSETL